MTFFIVIIYFKCLQRGYPYAGVSDSSLQESKLYIPEVSGGYNLVYSYVIMFVAL